MKLGCAKRRDGKELTHIITKRPLHRICSSVLRSKVFHDQEHSEQSAFFCGLCLRYAKDLDDIGAFPLSAVVA